MSLLRDLIKFRNKTPDRRRKALRDLAERWRVLEPIMRFRAHAGFLLRNVLPRRPHGLDRRLVVSLTSYPPRFGSLHLTLRTLLSQDLRPDRVVLYLFADHLAVLPRAVRVLTGAGLEIRTVAADIRSYKKLVPALDDFPNAIIVTADDDVRYRRTWLGELVAGYDPQRREVLGRRAHRLRRGESGAILPYALWEQRVAAMTAAAPDLMLTGVGGILYPPGIFGSQVRDARRFMALCPSTDDVWFYFMARLAGVNARKVGGTRKDYYWEPSQAVALTAENVEGQGNDAAMARMVAKYGNPLDPEFGRAAPSKAAVDRPDHSG